VPNQDDFRESLVDEQYARASDGVGDEIVDRSFGDVDLLEIVAEDSLVVAEGRNASVR